jgi:hypothetical protein
MRRALPLAFALALLPASALRAGDPEKQKLPPPHTDAQVAPALAAYEKDFAAKDAKDIDARLKAIRTLARWRHKDVLKELKRIVTREEDLELRAAAAEGFTYQTSFPAEAGRALADSLKEWDALARNEEPKDEKAAQQQKFEEHLLTAAWGSVGALGWKDGWKDWKKLLEHPSDPVATAAITAFGKLKEYRALPPLLEWFNFYPDGVTWSGGSVSVDTGADGGADQAAAEAAWRARFGARPKRARPGVVDALLKAVKEITGKEFTKPKELKAWMDENKLLLKKHGV